MTNQHNPSVPALDETDRRLIGLLDDLPIVDNPWKLLAEDLGVKSESILPKLHAWRDAGFFRLVRALFNADKLGYQSTLTGTAVPLERIETAAGIVSQSPFVSHNFLRQGTDLNLWFTLTCPRVGPNLDETIAALSKQLEATVRRFDTVRYFKISFNTLFAAGKKTHAHETADSPREFPNEFLVRTIMALQNDLPLTANPFADLARQAGLPAEDLIAAARLLRHRKILRRFGAILDLKNIEPNQNIMCVWDPPEDQIEAFGRHAASFPRISHCYQRVHYPDWTWKIYTVFHGRDRDDCLKLIDEVAADFPNVPRQALWTVREFKQTPIRLDPDKIVLAG